MADEVIDSACLLPKRPNTVTHTAMVRALPLLLLLLPLSPGGGPTLSLAEDCTRADQVVGSERQLIKSKDIGGPEGTLNVFVMPQHGFYGISIHVNGTGGTQHSAMFDNEPECFQQDDKWQQLQPWATIDGDDGTITIGFNTPTCSRGCNKDDPPRTLSSINVKAYGPSKWIYGTPPQDCLIEYLNNLLPSNLPVCKQPPASYNDCGGKMGGNAFIITGILLLTIYC